MEQAFAWFSDLLARAWMPFWLNNCRIRETLFRYFNILNDSLRMDASSTI